MTENPNGDQVTAKPGLTAITETIQSIIKDGRTISSQALPTVASNTFNIMMFTLGVICAHLPDKTTTAAGVLIQTFTGTFVHFISAAARSIGIAISHDCGTVLDERENDDTKNEARKRIAKMVQVGLIFTAVATVAVATLTALSQPILDHLDQKPSVVRQAVHFLQPFTLVLPPLAWRGVLAQVLIAHEDAKAAGRYGLMTLAISLSLASGLVFGKPSSQIDGLRGIALAYMLGNVINASLVTAYMRQHYRSLPWLAPLTRTDLITNAGALAEIAGPFLLARVSDVVLNFVLALLAGLLGEEAQSVWSYAMQVTFFGMALAVGYAMVTANYIARLRKVGDIKQADRMMRHGFLTMLLVVGLPNIVINAYPQSLYTLLAIPHGQRPKVENVLSKVTAAGYLQAVRFNLAMYLRALHYHQVTSLISMAAIMLGMAVAYLKYQAGLRWVASGYVVGELSASLGLAVLLCRVQAPSTPVLPTIQTEQQQVELSPTPPERTNASRTIIGCGRRLLDWLCNKQDEQQGNLTTIGDVVVMPFHRAADVDTTDNRVAAAPAPT